MVGNRGFADGLAYRHDFNNAITNFQREDALERNRRAEELAQTKMLYEGIEDAPDVMGLHDKQYIAQKYEQIVTDMGQKIKDNPNHFNDPAHFAELMINKKALQNDGKIMQAVVSTVNYKAWQDALKANPALANNSQMIKMDQDWRNYNETGTTVPRQNVGFTFVNPAKIADPSFYITEASSTFTFDALGEDQYGAHEYISSAQKMKKAVELSNDRGEAGLSLQAAFQEAIAQGDVKKDMNYARWIYNYMPNEKKYTDAAHKRMYGDGTGNDETGPVYSQYNQLYQDIVGYATPEYLKDLIPSYDKSLGTMQLTDGFIMLPDGRYEDYYNDQGYIDSKKQNFIKTLKSKNVNVVPTGRTVILGREQTITGDQKYGAKDMIGIEIDINLELDSESSSELILEEMEKAGLLASTDENFFGSKKDYANIDKMTSATKDVEFYMGKNKDNIEVPMVRIRGMVPHRYSQPHQMAYDKNYLPQKHSGAPIDIPNNAPAKRVGAIIQDPNTGRFRRIDAMNGQKITKTTLL